MCWCVQTQCNQAQSRWHFENSSFFRYSLLLKNKFFTAKCNVCLTHISGAAHVPVASQVRRGWGGRTEHSNLRCDLHSCGMTLVYLVYLTDRFYSEKCKYCFLQSNALLWSCSQLEYGNRLSMTFFIGEFLSDEFACELCSSVHFSLLEEKPSFLWSTELLRTLSMRRKTGGSSSILMQQTGSRYRYSARWLEWGSHMDYSPC